MTRRLLLVISAYALAYFSASYVSVLYTTLTSTSLGGTFVTPAAADVIVGVPLGAIALLIFFFVSYGGKHKWWWIGIAASPAILFEVLLDPLHIYVPIILGVIAWGLGVLANKALRKLAPGVMSKLQ